MFVIPLLLPGQMLTYMDVKTCSPVLIASHCLSLRRNTSSHRWAGNLPRVLLCFGQTWEWNECTQNSKHCIHSFAITLFQECMGWMDGLLLQIFNRADLASWFTTWDQSLSADNSMSFFGLHAQGSIVVFLTEVGSIPREKMPSVILSRSQWCHTYRRMNECVCGWITAWVGEWEAILSCICRGWKSLSAGH